jgi:two-component system, NarL family, response regulator NreC
MRDGLCALLKSSPGIEVVAAISTRREAVAVLTTTKPDLIVMDFSVTLRIGPATVAHLKRRWPRLRVLVLTARALEQFADAALQAGADGYILKNDSRAELFNAVQRLSSGKRYVSPSLLGRVELAPGQAPERTSRTRPAPLTNREQEVITLIARGFRTRDMAQMLALSHKTVEKHRANLMRKLGLRSAAAVAAYAITHGYL